MERKIKLKDLNPHITCNICKGYLIDATAITECLHTFCKSCLIKHLEANTNCPTCNMVIHHSYPRQYINFDRTMQDIVYKLVPGLEEREVKREKDFYESRGLPYPKEILGEDAKEENGSDLPSVAEVAKEELITVCLECQINSGLKRVFIRISTKFSIAVLKKIIGRKIYGGDVKLEVHCNCVLLEDKDSLKYVFLTQSNWNCDDVPCLVLKCNRVLN